MGFWKVKNLSGIPFFFCSWAVPGGRNAQERRILSLKRKEQKQYCRQNEGKNHNAEEYCPSVAE